ncbi:hypothetical protein C7H84_27505 [Burkholderia sp. Nafp2/4-1b]|uniref:hypothetical protein n=1 Tax=Burkholderia sp. Nafp2/4-1b TaxID=2116686 RepID=UPI000EF876B5|nr:hypothetical protein [Burkholderia sp. Nafp2/4-1b]RKU00210.1 hypothetical protein C7H84_27505 [Burkholderia sp. Nafp2/4-1b]
MNAASNAQQGKDTASTDERRSGGQRTVAPTRTRARVRAATSHDGTRKAERGGRNGPITTSKVEQEGKPLWEDDSGEVPPEEWS